MNIKRCHDSCDSLTAGDVPGDGRGPGDGAVAGDGGVVLDAAQRVGRVKVVVVHAGGRGGACNTNTIIILFMANY